MRTGTIHAANIKKSTRLQAILAALKEGPKTTLELSRAAKDCATGTSVSELRHNGFKIRCDFRNRTETGRSIYLYRLQK